MNRYYTYIYLDPRKLGRFEYDSGKVCFDLEPVYVGKGINGRAESHWNHIKQGGKLKERSPFLCKLKSLYNKGLEPIIIKVLENVTEEEAFDEEIRLIWVTGRKDLGMGTLLNMTWGGDGIRGYIHTEEDRKANSERQIKRFEDPKERKKTSKASKKHYASAEGQITKNKIAKKCKEISILLWENRTDEEYNEVCEKISKSNSGKIRTEEHKENYSKLKNEFYLSEEGQKVKDKIGQTLKGRKITDPEILENMSDGISKGWVDRKKQQGENRLEILQFLDNHPDFDKTQYGNYLSKDRTLRYSILNISLRMDVRNNKKEDWKRKWTVQYKDVKIINEKFIFEKVMDSKNQHMK